MESIIKKKMKDEIRNSIQNAILSGEIQPGDRLVETRIAADMGVSQAPVREALKELEHIGLVENRPYQGTYVRRLSKKDLQDAYDARILLEVYAVGAAARNATPKALAEMQQLMNHMDEAAREGKVSDFVEYDIDFHQAILKCAGNHMVERLWRMANVSLFTYVTTNLSKRSLDNLSHRHSDIFDTLKSGDEAGARQAMEVHLQELRDEMVARVED